MRSPDSSIPLERQVPPEPVGSPAQVPPHVDGEMWYLPGWFETARLLGWRWICFVPLIGLFLFFLVIPFQPWVLGYVLAWWKLIVFAIAIPIAALAKSAKTIIHSRKEPFCIHCGY